MVGYPDIAVGGGEGIIQLLRSWNDMTAGYFWISMILLAWVILYSIYLFQGSKNAIVGSGFFIMVISILARAAKLIGQIQVAIIIVVVSVMILYIFVSNKS